MTNSSAYVAFRRIYLEVNTLTSKDLFFCRTYSKVVTDISVGVVRQCAEDFKQTLLNAKSKECLTAEFVGHASVPQSKIGKHLDFINAIITSSEAVCCTSSFYLTDAGSLSTSALSSRITTSISYTTSSKLTCSTNLSHHGADTLSNGFHAVTDSLIVFIRILTLGVFFLHPFLRH